MFLKIRLSYVKIITFKQKKVTNFDQLLRDYFFESGELSIDKIGHLTKAGTIVSGDEAIPTTGTVSFNFDKRASTSPGLIEFISQKTGKSKTLVQVDLDSHLELMRQFLNIGKIYELEGIGSFKMLMNGDYEFLPIDESKKKEETKKPKKQKQSEPAIYSSAKSNNNRSVLMLFAVLIILAVIGIIGWGAYKLFLSGKENNITADTTTISTQPAIRYDSSLQTKDSLHADTMKIVTQPVSTDSLFYKFIFETTISSKRAHSRTDSLVAWGNSVAFDSIRADTVTYYNLYFKLKTKVADTARIKDSLSVYVGRSVRIEQANQ